MSDDRSHRLGRRTFLKATGAAGAAAAVGTTNVVAGRDPGPKEHELVVGLFDSASVQTAEVEIQEALPNDTEVAHRNDSLGYLAVATPESASTQARDRLKRQLEARDDVKYVEPNDTYETLAVQPNDPLFGDQFAPQQVNAPEAWENTLGNENVSVGIIDNGAGWGHENLEAQFTEPPGKDFTGGGIFPGTEAAADDVPDVPEEDWPSASGDQHGTHVAGIASATTDNATGTAGISNSQLYSLKALSSFGSGSLTDIADAIDWSTNAGLDVINMSLGGAGSQLLQDACTRAWNAGVLIIAAAGNDGPSGGTVSAPAIYDECVAVSALTEAEDIARFSSRGPEVEIAGPGAGVLSTDANNGYTSLSGTSMASPAVAGVAALGFEWAAEQGVELSNSEMRTLLRETARDVGLPDNEQGAGVADAHALLGEIRGAGPTGELTFEDQDLDDGAVTIDAVSTGQPSTIAVTYTDGDAEVIAGLAPADNLDDESVDVTIEDDGGFPGEHTAWVFDDDDVPEGVGIGDDAIPIAGDALDSDAAQVSDPSTPGELTFNDQSLDDGTVTVDSVTTEQPSTIAVTYTDGDAEIIAGLAPADNLDDESVDVTIEDDGGFPGEHTAWVFDDDDVPEGVGIGDDATPIADAALAADSALIGDVGPTAVITASTTDPEVGETVDLDGTESTSTGGDIVEYFWDADPGGEVTGPTAQLTRDERTTVEVTLTVTDETDETDSATETFEFGDDAECGVEEDGGSADGFLWLFNPSDTYSYETRTEAPCQLTIEVDGPSRADFDLYVTRDGRTPTPDDFDESSTSSGADEQVIIDDPADIAEAGILVTSVSGFGSYTVTVEELSI